MKNKYKKKHYKENKKETVEEVLVSLIHIMHLSRWTLRALAPTNFVVEVLLSQNSHGQSITQTQIIRAMDTCILIPEECHLRLLLMPRHTTNENLWLTNKHCFCAIPACELKIATNMGFHFCTPEEGSSRNVVHHVLFITSLAPTRSSKILFT